MNRDLENLAAMLMAGGKGILAVDETVPTLAKRFDSLGIPSTEQRRRTYWQMLFGSPGAADFISGAIMHDETIRQKSADGRSLVEMQTAQGMVPSMKVRHRRCQSSRRISPRNCHRGARPSARPARRVPEPGRPLRQNGAPSSMSRTTCRVLGSESGVGSVAWPGREPRSRAAGAIPPRQAQRCREHRQVRG